MTYRTGCIAAAILCAIYPSMAAASDKSWSHLSTVGLDALIGGALVAPVVMDDWDGGVQAGGSMAASALVSTGLKEAFPEMRPDRSNRRSFPSMHTSVAFSAAATLQNRYGWEVGVPAQVVAAFVGLARVQAHKHHWYDVAAGAAVGELSGFLITNKASSDVRVMPWGDSKGGGLAIEMRF
jgi:hypothetical protein